MPRPDGLGTALDATVLCLKWGHAHDAEHVNRLYGMAVRNLRRPARFLCLTDRPEGIWADVACHPIPDMPLPAGGDWRLLAAFSPEAVGLLGETVLFLDLDIVILGSLDAFFDEPGAFVMIRDRRALGRAGSASVLRFRPRRSTDVFEQYCGGEHRRIVRKFPTPAEYLAWYMAEFGALGFWPDGWCADFARDCVPRWPWRRWRTPRPPPESRIVTFGGILTPEQALAGGTCERGRFRPAPWIAEYWRA